MKQYIIIGSGPAGATAAETLRELDTKGKIVVITDEKYTYYKREDLVSFLAKEKSEDELYPKGKDFYDKIGATLLHLLVIKVDSSKNQVVLENNSVLQYNSLLIASGGKPIVPPWPGVNLNGISTLFTLEDAKKVADLMEKVKNVVIIGAGAIALKAIPLLSKFDLEISLIEKLDRIWPCMLDSKASIILEKKLRDQNINLYLNQEVTGFKGRNNNVNSVLMKNGEEIPADLVLITIGIRSNLNYLKDSLIKTDIGILADEYLRTNIPNVYVAGDIAQIPDPLYEARVLHPTWSYAEEQGKIAGYNMVNIEKRYEGAVALQTTGFYDLNIVTGGITQPEKETALKYLNQEFEEFSRLSVPEEFFKKFIVRNNKLIGIILIGKNINRKQLKPLVKKALLQRTDLSKLKEDLLNDSFDFNYIIK